MERRETTAMILERTARPRRRAHGFEGFPRARNGLMGVVALLLALLPCLATAEPAAVLAMLAAAEPTLPDVSAPPPAAIRLADEAPAEAPLASVHPSTEAIVIDPGGLDLEELFEVPGIRRDAWRPRTADERLAVAVAAGSQPDLEPPKPFRKRSRDLFRTERPVTIGNQDMVMRLRLRAKARKAVSVEFHF